jgi:serine/threonine protein kinase/Tol biopolymer transport system component
MTLATGTRLGSYEVVAQIGAGGMGEVYRARDTKLGRDVAIKVLPANFVNDPERLSRFQREARMLAALNHANIATIYGLEQYDGGTCLVMELVSGETLAERVKSGPLGIEEALKIAVQIAEALEAAHEKSIIHRDLKPANVKLTPEGKVKVLDFGLAKAFARDAANDDPSNSPTLSMAATMQGVILGTAAYMSPEQARGKACDKRTDIWAFGCVLYELLGGKAAFHGEDITDILAAVVRAEPDWNLLPPSTPTKIRDLVRRCLQKDKRLRLRDAGDAQIEIEEALAAPETAVAATAGPARRGWLERLSWAVAATFLLTTIGLGSAVFYLARVPTDVVPTRFFISPPEKATFDAGIGTGVGFSMTVISPDGRRLAFTARDPLGKILLWVRPLDTLAPQALQGTDNAAYPFWSPDSRSIGFFVQGQGKLKRIDVAGGPALTLCDAPSGIGGTWNRDGVIVFAPNTNGSLYRVAAAGGEPTAVTKTSPLFSHRHPSFLPDGRHFLYFQAGRTAESSGVFVAALDSDESKRLLGADTNALYSASGDLLFIRQGTLLRQSFDLKRLELSGDPTPVAEQVATSTNSVGAFSVSENGVLAYRNGLGATGGTVQLAWFDRAGKSVETIGEPGAYRGVNVSPDGKRIAVHRHDSNGGDIWIFDSARRELMSRFTFDASQDNSMPIWSSDGSRIAFGSLRNGKWGIYQKPANATGREELLVESDFPNMPMSWSPDGKFIAYWVSDPKTGSDVWVLPLAGDRKAIPFLQSPFNESWPQISPDGKWIAYSSNETGRYEIYVRPFPAGEGKWQISTNGGWFPRWRRDGKELFYMAASSLGKIISVKVNPAGPTFEYGDPSELFDSGYINFAHGHNYQTYAVSADGQRFLIPRPESTSSGEFASAPITVVLNWTAGLKK